MVGCDECVRYFFVLRVYRLNLQVLSSAGLQLSGRCVDKIVAFFTPLFLEVYSTLESSIDALKLSPSPDPIAADAISSFHFSSL